MTKISKKRESQGAMVKERISKSTGSKAESSRRKSASSSSEKRDKAFALRYGEVVDAAELSNIRLVRSEFQIRPKYFLSGKENVELDYSSKFELANKSIDDEFALGFFHWSATAKSVEHDDLLVVKATYLVLVLNLERFEQDVVSAFVERFGRMATYPYFRSHVSNICSEAQADVPILPMIKV